MSDSYQGNYSYHISKEFFCEKDLHLPYDDSSVRIVLRLRCTPHDDPEIIFSATNLVPYGQLLLEDTAAPIVSSFLSCWGIPQHDQTPLVQAISFCSRTLGFLETCPNCHRFLVPGIVLSIRVDKIIGQDDDILRAMEQLTMQA